MVKNGESPISKDILYKLCNTGIIGVKIGNVIRINANTIWYDLERAGLREFKQKGRTKIMLIE